MTASPRPFSLDEAAESEPVSMVVAIQCGRRADYELPRMQGLALNAAAVDGATADQGRNRRLR